jgi:PiT family inorganic phosphate transporter
MIALGLALLFQGMEGMNGGGTLLAPSIGARSLTFPWALAVAALAMVASPLIFGTHVAETITSSMVTFPKSETETALTGALSGAIVSVIVATWRKVPTSMSVAIVGGLVGSALAIHSPIHLLGVARVLFGIVLALVAGFVLGDLAFRAWRSLGRRFDRKGGERLMRLQSMALALQGFAYGANDAEKTMGLLAWILSASPLAASHIGLPIILVSSAAWIIGTLIGGVELAASMGYRVFRMRALHALAVQSAASLTVIAAAVLGNPGSSTQTINSSLLGVGAADRPRAVRWLVTRDMAVALAIAGPLAAIFSFVATKLLV